jgi:hypothetical protein
MSTDYRHWPYGLYIDRGFVTFFNRNYQPIAACPWFECEFPTRRLLIARQLAPVAPNVRINLEAKAHFYNDATSPTFDKKTRAMLQRVMDRWPSLAAEVAKREGVR